MNSLNTKITQIPIQISTIELINFIFSQKDNRVVDMLESNYHTKDSDISIILLKEIYKITNYTAPKTLPIYSKIDKVVIGHPNIPDKETILLKFEKPINYLIPEKSWSWKGTFGELKNHLKTTFSKN